MIRILLVDDQNLVQQGIKSLLDRNSEFKVVGTVTDGRLAVKHIDAFRPDVVLLDIEMPGMDGITATKYISRLSPKTKVIILSSHEDKKYVTQALMAGAKGYILKSSLMTDLKQSIIAVSNGYSQIESRLLAKVFDPSNIKSRSRKSEAKDRSQERNLDAAETILESRQPKSVTPQIEAERINRSEVVTLSKPDLDSVSGSIESNKAELAHSKPVTVTSRINLVKSTPLTDGNIQSEEISSAKTDDDTAKSPEINPVNPFLPAIIIKRSTSEISPAKNKVWKKFYKLLLRKARRKYQRANLLEPAKLISQTSHFYRLIVTRYQPTVKSYSAKFTKHWQKSSVFKQWQQKGQLSKIKLILLGVVTVLIIHLIIS